jgi:hypothetical protein
MLFLGAHSHMIWAFNAFFNGIIFALASGKNETGWRYNDEFSRGERKEKGQGVF